MVGPLALYRLANESTKSSNGTLKVNTIGRLCTATDLHLREAHHLFVAK